MKPVWPDTAVEEIRLARNISILRKALADGAAESSYIETIRRRGYRFQADAPPPPAKPNRRPSIVRLKLAERDAAKTSADAAKAQELEAWVAGEAPIANILDALHPHSRHRAPPASA